MKKEYLDRLEKLYTELNYKGWDGYGTDPISKQSYLNTKQVIEECSEEILKHFILFPGVWGELDFTLKGRDLIGGIKIGEDYFTYAAYEEVSKGVIGSNKPFALRDCIEALTEIVNFFNL